MFRLIGITLATLILAGGCQYASSGNSKRPIGPNGVSSIHDCPTERSVGDPPVPYHRPPPRYPRDAARAFINGRVLVEARLTAEGTIVAPVVIASEPRGIFDDAALSAVRQWRYCPIPRESPDFPATFRIIIPFVARR